MGASYSKKNWKPDSSTNECTKCRSPFTSARRRHHCRRCGDIFCAECSNKTSPIPKLNIEQPVRVCNDCYTMILVLGNTNPAAQKQNITQSKHFESQPSTSASTNPNKSDGTAAAGSAGSTADAQRQPADSRANNGGAADGTAPGAAATAADVPQERTNEQHFVALAESTLNNVRFLDVASLVPVEEPLGETVYAPMEVSGLSAYNAGELLVRLPDASEGDAVMASYFTNHNNKAAAATHTGVSDKDNRWIQAQMQVHLSLRYSA